MNVCNGDMFSVVIMYHDHLKFYVVCINDRMYAFFCECYVVSKESDEHTSCLVQPIGAHGGEVMYFRSFCFRGEFGFMNCDDICMCVVNKPFELIYFGFNSVYVHLEYNEVYLSLMLGLCACVVMWLSLVCLWCCLGTLCGYSGCGECDACTVVCVACEYGERV